MQSYVFDIVFSQYFGKSLVIYLVPYKTCTYNCIYCNLGKTTIQTTERKEWIPLNNILKQFQNKLSLNLDCNIISGLGEPTLFSRLGEMISIIKSMTDITIVFLINGIFTMDS